MLQRNMQMTAARPSDLKLNNRAQILELFKTGCVFSVAEIARRLGISRQTVMKAIQFFLEKGIIASDGKAASGSMGGKRAELFSLNTGRYLFNLLISPDYLYVSLFNCRCEVVDSCSCPDIAGMGAHDIVCAAGDACGRMLAQHGIRREDVQGVCVTTAGVVDHIANRVRFNSMFPGWGRDVPLAEKLAPYFDACTRIITENVGRVCGGSYMHEAEYRRSNVITMFSKWSGVGSCLMEGGRVLCRRDSLIGEIGHMMLNPEDPEVCNCGWRGCFERQVSVERIRSLIAADPGARAASRLAEKPVEEVGIRDVFAASEQGDALGRELSAYAARNFAAALRNAMLIFDPDYVILQGDYAWADGHFLETVNRELQTFKYYGFPGDRCRPFEIRLDRRSIGDLTTLGAYTLLIERLFSDEATFT